MFDVEGDASEDECTFWALANEYLEAAIVLFDTPPKRTNYLSVIYYLLGHSAELALKSFLHMHGKSIKSLTAMRHDLKQLIDLSQTNGLVVKGGMNSIVALSPLYKSKHLEYRKRKKSILPDANILRSEVDALLNAAFQRYTRKIAMETLYPVMSTVSPREVLAEHFKSLRGGLPIRGGWGYTKSDACIIDKDDPLVDPALPFDGVNVEYIFVEKRIYEEMIIFRPAGEKFSGISWNLKEQRLVNEGGRYFDWLNFEITAFPDDDWEELKAEFEGPKGFGTPSFDAAAHEKKRLGKMMHFTREFWFDITSFYGK